MFSRLLLSFVGSVPPLFCREHSLFLHLPADRSLPDPAFGPFPEHELQKYSKPGSAAGQGTASPYLQSLALCVPWGTAEDWPCPDGMGCLIF